ncbi:MAG TPA: MBL fold metallo-hydrolase [Kofleriaceae bacterium]|nr:MBL fold metallo-hydrolase [Kofleriaceae bacterium]
MSKRKTLLASLVAIAASSPAFAEPKLTTTVYTASPGGFLVNSTLVAGEKDAVLIDGQFTLADAHRLVAMVLESKKNLTTVYVTHYHPDHYFGLVVIKQAFPKAKLVATPETIKEIRKTWATKVKQWGAMYGDLVPKNPLVPAPLTGNALTLEGQTLEVHSHVMGDSADSSYVWIPSIKTVVTGDIVFNGVHPWTAESSTETRKSWIKSLDEISALKPTTVVAGHKDPKLADDASALRATRDYVEAFDAAVASSKTAAEVKDKVSKKYGSLQLPIILEIGAGAALPSATPSK